MDLFSMLFREFRLSRQESQKLLREMFYGLLSEEAIRTESKSKAQVRRLVNTMNSIIVDARLLQLLTEQEEKQFRAGLEKELFDLMNKAGDAHACM